MPSSPMKAIIEIILVLVLIGGVSLGVYLAFFRKFASGHACSESRRCKSGTCTNGTCS